MRRDLALVNYVSQIRDAFRNELAFAGFAFQSRFDDLSQRSSENRQEFRELKVIRN